MLDLVSFDLLWPKHRFRSGFVVGANEWFGIKALVLSEFSSTTGKVKSLRVHVLYVNFGREL